MSHEQVDEILTEDEAADLLAVSTYTLVQLRKSGKSPPWVRVGKVIRYSRSAILAWVAAGAPARAEGDAP